MADETAGRAERPLWSRTDFALAVLLAIVMGMVALSSVRSFVAAGNRPEFYQRQFGPAVLLACGKGFHNPPGTATGPDLTPYLQPDLLPDPGFEGLSEFLAQSRQSLDCSELPPAFESQPIRSFQTVHLYLLGLFAASWYVFGVSWDVGPFVSAGFAGLTAALVYLLCRTGMGPILAVALTLLWILSPLQLAEMPHLRDYAKAPFFMFTACAAAWIALTRASRATTLAALTFMGAVIGIGFGMRTEVGGYLPLLLLTLVAFRPGFDRRDARTRLLAAGAAVVAFLIVAFPMLASYQSGNNLAHVALLGLTDPSRDWLQLREAPYSFGYLHHDGYVATVLAGFADRSAALTTPLVQGTGDYARWGDLYYGQLLRTFTADVLVRAWAAVISIFDMPFQLVYALRPPWVDASYDGLFTQRAVVLSWLRTLPPLVAGVLFAVGIGTYRLRLVGLFLLLAVVLPGMTSVQYHRRHVFHFEIVALFVYGCLLHGIWRFASQPQWWRRPAFRAYGARVALVTAGMAAVIVVPVIAARQYQSRSVTRLFESYEGASVRPIALPEASAGDGEDLAMVPIVFPDSHGSGRWIDTNVLRLSIGGEQCGSDQVRLRFRYHAEPPFADLTRETIAPAPPPGSSRTLVMFPVYTLGRKNAVSGSLQFEGVEVAADQRACIASVDAFSQPERFPLLIESILLPDWRQRPLYESLLELERAQAEWRPAMYSVPSTVLPDRRRLSRLEVIHEAPTYRSAQVRRLEPGLIESRGTAATSSAYLLTWPSHRHPGGSAFFVEGEVIEGGLTIGIHQNERWVQQVDVARPGHFRAVVQIDADGVYRAVLANHQLRGLYNRTTITRYGWLPPPQ
jgi:hypothetical protein